MDPQRSFPLVIIARVYIAFLGVRQSNQDSHREVVPELSCFSAEGNCKSVTIEVEDDYEEYVPVAKRRAREAHKFLQRKANATALDDELDKSNIEELKPNLYG
ncbi:hypothetical protein LINPERPRIM_LOCUS31293 [Linum perenne]